MGSRPKDDLRVTPPPRPTRKGEALADVDVEKLWESIDKISSAVNKSAKHTEQIPEIKKKVDSTSDKVVALDTKMDAVTGRVTKVEDKVDRGHDCFQVDVIAELKDGQREASQKIEKDVQKGIKQAGEIAILKKDTSEVEADVSDIKKAPRRMFYGLVGLIVTVILLGLAGYRFVIEMRKDVEFERTQRTEQFKRLEGQVKAVGQKADTTPIKNEIDQLERAVKVSNGHEEEYNRLCDTMSSPEKRQFRGVLMRRGKRIPRSCM